ncbi:MAG: IPT/TIG domain-containing protein, partial [Planctomycetota bacterium]
MDVGLTDPLNGLDETVKTVPFTYVSAREAAPEILYVDTTVEVPINPTDLPALNVAGGDRMLIIGRNFDQRTTFDITKPQESQTKGSCTEVEVLTPNIVVCRAPASPDELPGIADLQGHNDFGDSNLFPVEYVEPGPPAIIDVRNLDTGDTNAPIDANDRLLIFGDNFFAPVTVRLTGCDINDQGETITVTLDGSNIALVEDHLIGVSIPADTFCEGPLDIEVVTAYGTVSFDDEEDQPIFQLTGPQPPEVLGVFETKFNSGGGEAAIFFGRNFTSTTEFSVRTDNMEEGVFAPVYNMSTRVISSTVATVVMPQLDGGMPPLGVPGQVRAEEVDPTLANKIAGDKFTISEDLFSVCDDAGAILLGVYPDHGSIAGGEQVMLAGAGFLKATGVANVTGISFEDDATETPIGEYTELDASELPLSSLNPEHRGKYVILNDHQILLITNTRAPIVAPDTMAPANVSISSGEGTWTLNGAYVYQNSPAEITPVLLGITPNETRLDGGTSHLVSGGFLTSADRLVFSKGETTLVIESSDFAEVNDNFIVFLMPDLSETFAAGDILALHAEKDLGGGILKSNTINTAIKVSFAGPPTITPDLTPDSGSAFGGQIVKFTGTLFTSNSQVLFGTMPAKQIVVAGPTEMWAVAPALPVSAPAGGLSLDSMHEQQDTTVDVAVFTQGGWAVLADGYTFDPAGPTFESCSQDEVLSGETINIMVKGGNFVPGKTKITPILGEANNVVVHDFNTLSFDYTAPLAGTNEIGPDLDTFKIATNMGDPADGCTIRIQLPPFLTGCESTYAANSSASPTTGVADGALIEVTVSGGNLEAGGKMWMARGGTADTIPLTEVTGDFTGDGQWKRTSGLEIVFTVPNIFSADTPTLLEGNRNIGPVSIKYESPGGRTADLSGCFSYVPAFQDFEDFNFTVVNPAAPLTARPDKVTLGDINQDGVLDVALLVRGDDTTWLPLEGPEVYILMADTFGDNVDINGDGVTPDFAGSFTQQTISSDDVQI